MKSRTVLKCKKCSSTADLNDSPKAWNGWQVIPVPICPSCITKGLVMNGVEVRESVHNGKVIRTFHMAGQS